MDWKVHNILLDDDKIIDVVTIFGDHFPKAGNILASKSYSEPAVLSPSNTRRELSTNNQDRKLACSSGEKGGETEANDVHIRYGRRKTISLIARTGGGEMCGGDEKMVDIVRVFLEPHEGQEISSSPSSPFGVLPKQLVILLYTVIVAIDFSINYCG